MTQAPPRRLDTHLVGSVPLADADSVFRRVSAGLGATLRRLPDGETGRRADWIGFVRRGLGRNAAFEKDTDHPPFQFKQWDGKVLMEWPLLRFRADADRTGVRFETGYADDALASWAIFSRLQAEGVIPAGVRYQACAATPLAIAYMYLTPADRADFTRAYTAHLLAELGRVADTIPHDRLAWQWDVCQEVLMWEGFFAQHEGHREEILAELAELGDAVPADVELGYHLCYGSPADEHCVQPRDMGVLVAMANGILAGTGRRVDYLHLPVPAERADDAYFAPLDGLALPAETALYLGCVHSGDSTGNAARLAAASRHASVAGVGTECGWGRGSPERLDALLAAHAELAAGEQG